MDEPLEYCVYYEKDTEEILDFFPTGVNPDTRNTVITFWEQDIPRKILKAVSEEPLTMQELRKRIGHSNSTLHENVKKLEEADMIRTSIVYEKNKIRTLTPRFLFVTKAPRFKSSVQKFFQGLWVNSKANDTVIDFLTKNKQDFWTAEEIAAKTNLTVDEVELVLSNWDSQVTRALSDFMKKKPFEKKTLYRGI